MALGVSTLLGCQNSQQNHTSSRDTAVSKKESQTIGGSKDEHGCLTGAGETWSEIKQGCIKVFDIGFRLNPVKMKEGDAVISAFVVMSDDHSAVELFLPDNNNKHIILAKTKENLYQKDQYKYDAEKSYLYVNDELQYIGNVE